MKRNIITIDEEKCNGCGICIPDCPEGALQVIDGKARLVSDLFCDGLGACIGNCPVGAISVEEREAEPYDERRVMENIVKGGPMVIRAHLKHLDDHGESSLLKAAIDYLDKQGIPVPDFRDRVHVHGAGQSCPGSMALDFSQKRKEVFKDDTGEVLSELRQWPVQLKLLNPSAQYFENADILLSADCVPFAFGDFHRRFLRDKVVITFCPKLDPYIDEYIDKLAAIFSLHSVNSVSIVRMEVPCCGGIETVLQKAMEKAGRFYMVKTNVISTGGEIV